ncbi:uncharacterized protein [Palaemon carinicauda]|uniref:uncharacterized protein n=1 Tax=Palaemon carinicauda TaxID=392227 RepID=UPI0035B5D7EB
MQLPQMKLERFSGDLTIFSMFKNSFSWIVEYNTDDPARSLTHLYNCLDGTPKNLMENCFHLPTDIGNDCAWEILCRKYKNDNDLSYAYVKKLFYWKEINAGDIDGLENYAASLKRVKAALGITQSSKYHGASQGCSTAAAPNRSAALQITTTTTSEIRIIVLSQVAAPLLLIYYPSTLKLRSFS